MKKSELVKAVAKDAQITLTEAGDAVNSVFENIAKALATGDSYTAERFAVFSVVERAERKGRNPQTNEQIIIPAQKAVRVKIANRLKNMINGRDK